MSDNRVLFLHALTSLHPGSGSTVGVVDLPVMRERHTHWPMIPASALKGVMRDKARNALKGDHGQCRKKTNEEDGFVTSAFGPGKIDESSGYSGALNFTDSRILLFPVRSMKGVFAWVTCPGILARFARDLELAGKEQIPVAPANGQGKACVTSLQSPLLVKNDDGQKIILEEFDFKVGGFCADQANSIAEMAFFDDYSKEKCKTNLVILNDDDFTHFAKTATEISARIALDYEKKTAKEGALFYQEMLPPETVFYSLLLSNDSRNRANPRSAGELLTQFQNIVNDKVIQIGGDETTGKGLCRVKIK